jgi:hypothetical protein
VVEQLPHQDGVALLAAARDAFAHSMQLMAVICAVLVVATAIMTAILLKRVPSAG